MVTTHKIDDTITFLNIARKVIYEFIEESEFPKDRIVLVKNFILNEASDYEIMSILLDGSLPTYRYDLVMESVCCNKIKKRYGKDFDFVPLSLYNLSSQPHVRRFVIENKLFEQDETEKWKEKAEEEIKNRNLVRRLPGVSPEQKALLDKKAEYAYLKYKESESEKKIKVARKRGEETSDIKEEKEEFSKKIEDVEEELQDAKEDIPTTTGAEGAAFSVVGSTAKSMAISSMFNSLYSNVAKGITYIKPMLSAFLASPAGQAIGSALLVSIVSFAAYKAYRNVFMKAQSACLGFEGEERDQCILRYKVDALQARINDLKSGLAYCTHSKDPDNCAAKIKLKINKNVEKITKIKEKGIV